MNIKANVVNEPKHVVLPYSKEQKSFIAERIKRQNKKRFDKHCEFTKTVFQMIGFFILVGFGIFVIAGIISSYQYSKAKREIETQALIQQLEKGEVIEMTARVGGRHD